MANVITIHALNKYVKSVLESDPVLTDIALRGEISGFVHHQKSGHFYFQLKDEQASVKAVMFKTSAQKLGFLPENGMRVVVRCRISLYERDGAFQVYVEDLFPDGIGAAQLAFEQLKEKLEKEGLFDAERKKPLPAFPHKIGLITSKSGAALQDIISVSQRRFPLVEYLLCSVSVQGINAEKEIAAALQTLSARDDLDCIIVSRGGGSKEDLWVFNSEAIARAAAKSKVPVVSAVGHEIDFTILDFVADLRAPTPSAAVEMVLPNADDLLDDLNDYAFTAKQEMQYVFQNYKSNLQNLEKHISVSSLIQLKNQKQSELQATSNSIFTHMQQNIAHLKNNLQTADLLLHNLNPEQIFQKGYAVLMQEGMVLNDVDSLRPNDEINILSKNKDILCTVKSIQERKGLKA